ncbi:hypothetical protein [Pantoea eucrina]|uniref:hypothetical protein n=1 Tax=Pantoea eucrina TaxID=472693 RepID=UPI002FDA09CB
MQSDIKPKERPILLNAEMVRAVLDGRKTQTRRMLTSRHMELINLAARAGECYPLESGQQHENSQSYYREFCPFGAVGDRLWVREKTRVDLLLQHHRAHVRYEADGEYRIVSVPERIKPMVEGSCMSNGCYREASRITLEITGVRVERLNSINEHDAIAEGLAEISKDGRTYKYGVPDPDGYPGTDDFGWPWHEWERYPISAYSKLWKSIYGKGSWQANPWVWVIEFKRVEAEHA